MQTNPLPAPTRESLVPGPTRSQSTRRAPDGTDGGTAPAFFLAFAPAAFEPIVVSSVRPVSAGSAALVASRGLSAETGLALDAGLPSGTPAQEVADPTRGASGQVAAAAGLPPTASESLGPKGTSRTPSGALSAGAETVAARTAVVETVAAKTAVAETAVARTAAATTGVVELATLKTAGVAPAVAGDAGARLRSVDTGSAGDLGGPSMPTGRAGGTAAPLPADAGGSGTARTGLANTSLLETRGAPNPPAETADAASRLAKTVEAAPLAAPGRPASPLEGALIREAGPVPAPAGGSGGSTDQGSAFLSNGGERQSSRATPAANPTFRQGSEGNAESARFVWPGAREPLSSPTLSRESRSGEVLEMVRPPATVSASTLSGFGASGPAANGPSLGAGPSFPQLLEVPVQSGLEMDSTLEMLPQELGRTLRLSLQQGGRSAVIHLSPPELGKVRIDLSLAGDRVTAQVSAERGSVRALLEQSRGGLEQHLQRAGFVLDRLVVEGPDAARIPTGSGEFAGGGNGARQGSHSRDSDHPMREPPRIRETGLSSRWSDPARVGAVGEVVARNSTSRSLDRRV